MRQVDTARTEQIWKVAMGSTKYLEEEITPQLLTEYLDTMHVPDPILALALDRIIHEKGRKFLMTKEYENVLYTLVNHVERVFNEIHKISNVNDRLFWTLLCQLLKPR